MSNTTNAPANVTVPVKSAAASKINWIAVATTALVVLNETTDVAKEILPYAPPKYQHFITVAIAVAGGVATIIARTFFTTSITPASAVKV